MDKIKTGQQNYLKIVADFMTIYGENQELFRELANARELVPKLPWGSDIGGEIILTRHKSPMIFNAQ